MSSIKKKVLGMGVWGGGVIRCRSVSSLATATMTLLEWVATRINGGNKATNRQPGSPPLPLGPNNWKRDYS